MTPAVRNADDIKNQIKQNGGKNLWVFPTTAAV
jgi:hypothetical protein